MALVIVPVKPLASAKRRLAPALSAEERRTLCLAMLADVIAAATASQATVWAVTCDADAAAIVEAAGARAVGDPTPKAGLNPSLAGVVPSDAAGVLILASDLPAATAEDVRAVASGSGVALAPDRAGTGTNALWRSPPDAIPLAFGEGSFRAHETLARERGVPFRIVARDGLALDVDTPTDLTAAWSVRIGAATRAALAGLGFPNRARRLA